MAKEEKKISPAVVIIPFALGLVALGAVAAMALAAPPITKPFTCPYCGATFSTYEELIAHIQAEHPGQPLPSEVTVLAINIPSTMRLGNRFSLTLLLIPPSATIGYAVIVESSDRRYESVICIGAVPPVTVPATLTTRPPDVAGGTYTTDHTLALREGAIFQPGVYPLWLRVVRYWIYDETRLRYEYGVVFEQQIATVTVTE